MPISGFNHYNLRANRATLDSLRDFYVSVVGLMPGHRPPFNNFGYWLYVGPNAVLHLTEARPDEDRPAGVANTFDHVAFASTHFAEFEQHLQRLDIVYRTSHVPLTGQRQIFFRDPAGNGVELNFADDEH